MDPNKCTCGDCMDLFKEIGDNTINLVVTSPHTTSVLNTMCTTDRLTWEEYLDWSRRWLKEVYRVLKPDGRFCLNHHLSCDTVRRFAPLMDLQFICEHEVGFKHHGVALWNDRTLTKHTAWGSYLSA